MRDPIRLRALAHLPPAGIVHPDALPMVKFFDIAGAGNWQLATGNCERRTC
jgi:hypothetical protein